MLMLQPQVTQPCRCSSSSDSGCIQAWMDCIPKSQGANIDHAWMCWSPAKNKHSPA